MNVNISNLKRVCSYHDKELRSKANWIEKNNNYNVMHLMSDSIEGKAGRKDIEQAYFDLIEGLSQVFEALPIDENAEVLIPYKQ